MAVHGDADGGGLTTYTIGHLWDGTAVPSSEQVHLSLHGTVLRIDAPFHGDPAPDAPVGRTWELWEHEVVELFVVGADGAYIEIEVGPHGHWLGLGLDGPRNIVAFELPVPCRCQIAGDRWTAEVELAELLPTEPVRLNAYAIHGQGADRRYLALTPLPGPRPDYHQPDRFTVVWPT